MRISRLILFLSKKCYNNYGDTMNKKHELLVPAGDMECLMQAVANGADAVYVGLKNFGARKFARNFDYNEIVNFLDK